MAPRPSPFKPAPRPGILARTVPVLGSVKGYERQWATRDIIAGITVAAVAIPSAMGYAEVAGLSPIAGLYAQLVPVVVYAFLGSSRQVIVGPDGALSARVGATVLGTAVAGSAEGAEIAAMLALLVAACFLIARALRLGWLADYLSLPVLVGYMHGVVIVLVIGQLPKLLGLHVEAIDPIPQLVEIAKEIGETSLTTLAVGAIALAIAVPLRFRVPRFPAPLVLVVGGIIVSSALSLSDHGVAVVGPIPSGLPSIEIPTLSFSTTADLVPTAVGMFLLAFADGVLTARSFAGRHRQHVRAGQELLAFGGANVAAGLTQAFPVAVSGSRTAVNDAAGSRTQIAGLASAGVIALVLLFLTGQLTDLPKAILGAIIISAALGLVDVGAWRELARTDHVELAIAGVTTAGVVITGVLPAIAFAVGLSIVDVVRRSARPHDAVLGYVPKLGRWGDVAIHRKAQVTPGVVVYRVDDRIFFANARYVKARAREAVRGAATPTRFLVLDASGINHVDIAGMEALGELEQTLQEEGTTLVLAHVNTPVSERLERELDAPVYPTVRAAVEACARSSSESDDAAPAPAGDAEVPHG